MSSVTDFTGWRAAARGYLMAGLSPDRIDWRSDAAEQGSLFGAPQTAPFAPKMNVPRPFLDFAARIACHRDEARWHLLYQALWRLTHGEPHLLRLVTDPLILRLRRMEGEIRRDAHKTKAFVRFRQIVDEGHEHYIAWHRPDHYVLPLIAPFFKRRFQSMRWSILTPDASVAWDGVQLRYGLGVTAENAPQEDSTEDLWLSYYRATFNPARVNVKLMKREMPVRHWATLPEAALIPQLLAEAPQRVQDMVSRTEGLATSAADFMPESFDYDSLRAAALKCQGCPLHCHATQTVFGEGPANAAIMLVGEQPGDQEDLQGRAFVGPAGQVLDTILQDIQLPRRELYLTNAVKHFKFDPRPARRLHRAPDAKEIKACKPWLIGEIGLIKPKVIVTLGNTAARSLIHQGFTLKQDGDKRHFIGDIPLLATWHPSAILRAPDDVTKAAIRKHMQARLKQAVFMAIAEDESVDKDRG